MLYICWCDPESPLKKTIEGILTAVVQGLCSSAAQKIWPLPPEEIQWPFEQTINFSPVNLNEIVSQILYGTLVDNTHQALIPFS
jgi:hypothetical protein